MSRDYCVSHMLLLCRISAVGKMTQLRKEAVKRSNVLLLIANTKKTRNEGPRVTHFTGQRNVEFFIFKKGKYVEEV